MADESTTETALVEADLTPEMPAEDKLAQNVEISDVGPCKKHVKVTVERKAIDQRFHEKYTEILRSNSTPMRGFRPGKTPRKIIERRFKSDVAEQVRNEVLMASLEQIANDNQISPLAPPELDPQRLDIPDAGDFVYEFDVEVRPEFDLPAYKGVKLTRYVKTFSDADIARERKRVLEPHGQMVPKDGAIELDDYLVAEVTIKDGDKQLNKLSEVRVKVEEQLAMADGIAPKFAKAMVGAKAGETRSTEIHLSENPTLGEMAGKTVNAEFAIQDVKFMRSPELTPELLEEFGVRSPEQLDELIHSALEKRLEYAQRQAFRQQVLATITSATQWDLPQDLLQRQSRRHLQRKVMEMRSSGMADDQIMGRLRLLERDTLQSTAAALKEHFILQKVAELEKIEIEDDDINDEIDRIADRMDESPRKVRARMEKEELIEPLAMELLERKALDVILEHAEYTEAPMPTDNADEGEVASVSEGAMPAIENQPQG